MGWTEVANLKGPTGATGSAGWLGSTPGLLPATSGQHLTTQGGNTLDDGSGNVVIQGGTIDSATIIRWINTATGAVARAISSKLQDSPPSVFDFGAVGDGVTDDTEAFQAAAALGRSIYVPDPASFYHITGTISPVSGTIFYGGEERPTIQMDNASNALLFNFSSATGAGLSQLTLDGNKAVAPTSQLVTMNNCTSCFLEDLNVLNCPGTAVGGIILEGSTTYCHVLRVRFTNAEGACLGLTGSGVQGNLVQGCEWISSGLFGLRIGEKATRNRVVENYGFDTGWEPIGLTAGCDYNIISNNHCEGAGDDGISVSGDYNVVTGNTCVGNWYAGVGVWGSYNTITGNILLNNGQSDAAAGSYGGLGPSAGVWIANGFGGVGQYNVVSSNVIDDDQTPMTQNWLVYITPNVYTAWASAQVTPQYNYCYNGLNVYQATTGGTTGATAPTHTSGAVSDGGVTWTYITSARVAMHPRMNSVVNNIPGRNLSGQGLYDTGSWVTNELIGSGQDKRYGSYPSSPSGLLPYQIWMDTAKGGILKVTPATLTGDSIGMTPVTSAPAAIAGDGQFYIASDGSAHYLSPNGTDTRLAPA